MPFLNVRSGPIYQHLRHLNHDGELIARLRACIRAQRAAVEHRLSEYVADPDALRRVSEEALQRTVASGADASDIRTEACLSDCLVFHADGLRGSVIDPEVIRLRKRADDLLSQRIRALMADESSVSLVVSGHFWYPPGSYMGWHTNSRVPGWRIYVTYGEVPRRSFFRYRDPDTQEVVTSWDDGWDLRMFRVDSARPFWHAVYSDTDRYSFGYRVVSDAAAATRWQSALGRLVRRLRGAA